MTEAEKKEDIIQEPILEKPTENIPAETPPAETTSETPPAEVPPQRHAIYGRLSEMYPDNKFEGENDALDVLLKYVDDAESYKSKTNETNQALVQLFNDEPILVEIIRDMKEKGLPFTVAAAKYVSPEDFNFKEGDDNYDQAQERISARNQRNAERTSRQETLSKNTTESLKAIKEFAAENGLSEEDAMKFMDAVDVDLADLYAGKITKAFLNKYYKAQNYEKAISDASAAAEISGKNQQIEAKLSDKPLGDGLPEVPGAGGEIKDKTQKSGIDRTIERATGRKIDWDKQD